MTQNKLSILRILVLICLAQAFPGTLEAQQSTDPSYLNWFDQQVGIENTPLYEGIIYREFYRTINDQVKFFKSARWYQGSVNYSGQEFHNIEIKYDVFGDELILKQLDRLGGGGLQLIKSNIRSFQIDGTSFVNVTDISADSGASGFYELLWQEGGHRLLAKHQKKDFLRKDRRALYYEFIDDQKKYMLDMAGKYFALDRKKDLVEVFPVLKKQIDSFYQKNKRLRNNQPDIFMINLMRDIHEQISTPEPDKNP